MFASLFENDSENGDYSDTCVKYNGDGTSKTDTSIPPACRPTHGLCGIINQGATCYLNSLLQTLVYCPEFTEWLFLLTEIDLGTLDDKSDAVQTTPNKAVRIIPLQLQRLFSRLLLSHRQSVSTKELTDSFGWTNNEQSNQHDVQELNRILFTAIDDSLIGTRGQDMISSLYHGSIVNTITCDVCGRVSDTREDFLDLPLTVRGFYSVVESLSHNFVTHETLSGANQYRCSVCGKLVNATKRAKLKTLPTILTLSLLRFSYDIEKGKRIKETNRMTFGYSLDMSPYVDKSCDQGCLYELFSVVVHKGGAHGGHYHAYIRDIRGLGHWDLNDVNEEFNNEQKEDQDGEWKTAGKGKSKKNRKNDTGPSNPTPPKDGQCWFDFNDATVKPVLYEQLETSFMGKESAYMLFYRRVQSYTCNTQQYSVPPHLVAMVTEENTQLHLEREAYETKLNTISIELHTTCDYVFTRGALQLTRDAYKHQTVSIDRRKPCLELLELAQEILGTAYSSEYIWQRLKILPAGGHLYDVFNLENSMSVQEMGITDGCLIFIWNGTTVQGQVISTGETTEPILVNLVYKDMNQSCGFAKDLTLAEFKIDVSGMFDLPTSQFQLVTIKRGRRQEMTSSQYHMTLEELGFTDGLQIHISEKSEQRSNVNNNMKDAEETFIVYIEKRIDINNCETNEQRIVYSIRVSPSMRVRDMKKQVLSLCGECMTSETRLRVDDDDSGLLPALFESQTISAAGIKQDTRLVIEAGTPPMDNQITVLFSLADTTSTSKHHELVIDIHTSLSHCLIAAANKVGVNASEYHLCRSNWCGEAGQVLDDGEISLVDAHVSNGDRLLLQPGCLPPKGYTRLKLTLCSSSMYEYNEEDFNKDVSHDSSIYQSNGSFHLPDVVIPKISSLYDLKLKVMTLVKVTHGDVSDVDRLRLQLIEDGYFTTVLKGTKIPLQNLRLSTDTHIAVKILHQSEKLSPQHILLNISQRVTKDRTYLPPQELVWDTANGGATVDSLLNTISHNVQIDIDSLIIAKRFYKKFEWLVISDGMWGQLKNKKNKKQNLRQAPYFLRDGDFIGVKDAKSCDPEEMDGFSTEADDRHHQELKQQKELLQQQREERRINQSSKVTRPEVSLSIKVDKFT